MINTQKSKFIDWIKTESDIIITPVKLEIKKSTCKTKEDCQEDCQEECQEECQENLGVFACEFIPADTYICKSNPNDTQEDSISRKINDLGYEGSAILYEENYEYAESKSNLVYVNVKDTFGLEGNISTKKPLTFIKTLKDIQLGEELSRHYGIDYWYQNEYYIKHKQSLLNKNLPFDYYFIDEFRIGLEYNNCLYIFGKCINDKYYYVKSVGILSSYYTKINEFNKLPIFKSESDADEYINLAYGKPDERTNIQWNDVWNFKYLIDISKSDNSKYELDEPISEKRIMKKNDCVKIYYDKYYSTKYLKTKPVKYFNSRQELNDYIKNTTDEEKYKYNLQVDYFKQKAINL